MNKFMIKKLSLSPFIVDREIARGTSTSVNILSFFGGGRVLVDPSPEQTAEEIMRDSQAFGIGIFAGAVVQLIFGALSIDILNRGKSRYNCISEHVS